MFKMTWRKSDCAKYAKYNSCIEKLFELDAAYEDGACTYAEYLASQLDILEEMKQIKEEREQYDN